MENLKLEIFKTIYHPGRKVSETISECKLAIEWITDANDGKPDGQPKKPSRQATKTVD